MCGAGGLTTRARKPSTPTTIRPTTQRGVTRRAGASPGRSGRGPGEPAPLVTARAWAGGGPGHQGPRAVPGGRRSRARGPGRPGRTGPPTLVGAGRRAARWTHDRNARHHRHRCAAGVRGGRPHRLPRRRPHLRHPRQLRVRRRCRVRPHVRGPQDRDDAGEPAGLLRGRSGHRCHALGQRRGRRHLRGARGRGRPARVRAAGRAAGAVDGGRRRARTAACPVSSWTWRRRGRWSSGCGSASARAASSGAESGGGPP